MKYWYWTKINGLRKCRKIISIGSCYFKECGEWFDSDQYVYCDKCYQKYKKSLEEKK